MLDIKLHGSASPWCARNYCRCSGRFWFHWRLACPGVSIEPKKFHWWQAVST